MPPRALPVLVGLTAAWLGLARPAAADDEPPTPASEHAEARDPYPSLHVLGFGDADFFAQSGETSPSSGFFGGQLVLHFTSALSGRWSFFGEISASARRDAVTNAGAHAYAVEVERAIIKFAWKDPLKVGAGRFHTPHNYWNVAFHHGTWLQTSISRPEMIAFGGQFLPVHFIGLELEGTVRPGPMAVDYQAGIGNGRSTVISRGGDAGDVNGERAVLAALAVRPDRPSGLRLGGAVYRDLVTLATGDHREWILAAHVALAREDPEVLAEYAWVRHGDGSGASFRSHGYYVQVAYRLPRGGRRFKPYARWDELRIANRDPVFAQIGDRSIATLGLRFDASELVALKGELRHRREESRDDASGVFAQVSFTF